MGRTSIEWTDFVFNPWSGCTKIDAGCQNCAAERFAQRFPGKFGTWGPEGKRVIASDSYWRKPYRWNRAAEDVEQRWRRSMEGATWARADGKVCPDPPKPSRPRVFCGMMMDVFEDRPDLREPRARLRDFIGETENLDYLFLTKRIENADRLWEQARVDMNLLSAPTWPKNVWLGTSVSTQDDLNRNGAHLLRCLAKVHFLSAEPLLEKLDCSEWLGLCDGTRAHKYCSSTKSERLDWMIAGCESGPKRRHVSLDAFRSLRDQCVAAGVPFFLKAIEVDGKLVKMPELDGKVWDQLPEVKP